MKIALAFTFCVVGGLLIGWNSKNFWPIIGLMFYIIGNALLY